jgi:hypothetical protein
VNISFSRKIPIQRIGYMTFPILLPCFNLSSAHIYALSPTILQKALPHEALSVKLTFCYRSQYLVTCYSNALHSTLYITEQEVLGRTYDIRFPSNASVSTHLVALEATIPRTTTTIKFRDTFTHIISVRTYPNYGRYIIKVSHHRHVYKC